MKYQKIPVVIDAVQFTRYNFDEIERFSEGKCVNLVKKELSEDEFIYQCSVHTLEGTMTATENDYIIKGIQGEFYPCKPDIFKETYIPVK